LIWNLAAGTKLKARQRQSAGLGPVINAMRAMLIHFAGGYWSGQRLQGLNPFVLKTFNKSGQRQLVAGLQCAAIKCRGQCQGTATNRQLINCWEMTISSLEVAWYAAAEMALAEISGRGWTLSLGLGVSVI